MPDELKYLFTMGNHFTKYGWIILLKDKTAKNVLGTFKNVLQRIMFRQPCRLIMEQNLKIIY